MKPINLILSSAVEEHQLCDSHFWGNPHLPKGVEFPTYTDADGDTLEYRFICQINLADIASLDVDNILPHKGLLSFFAKIERYLGNYDDCYSLSGYISDADDVKVLYFPDAPAPGEESQFVEVVLLDEDDTPVNPMAMKMEFSHSRPADCYEEHALFAEPTHREWESWDPPFEEWQILLQIDSFDGDGFNLNFMDCGVLDLLISPQALAAHDFGNVRGIVLST